MEGYIFYILQHFATKLCNFTNFSMPFPGICMRNCNTKVYKICKLCKATFPVFYNISQPNFAIIYYFSMLLLAVVIYLHQGQILRRGVERCAPPLRSFCTSPENICISPENICTSPERSCTSPWESVSMMDQSENVMVA